MEPCPQAVGLTDLPHSRQPFPTARLQRPEHLLPGIWPPACSAGSAVLGEWNGSAGERRWALALRDLLRPERGSVQRSQRMVQCSPRAHQGLRSPGPRRGRQCPALRAPPRRDRPLQFCRGNKCLHWDQVSPVEAKWGVTMASLVFRKGKATGPLTWPFAGDTAPSSLGPFLPPLVLGDKPNRIIRFTLNAPSYPPISMSLTFDSEVLR